MLQESYRTCRRLQRRHDPTFYVATGCLPRYGATGRPRPVRLRALRGRDRRRPGAGPGGPEARRAALDAWQAALRAESPPGGPSTPWSTPLVDAGARHDLPLHLLPRYMDSMRLDCGPVRMRAPASPTTTWRAARPPWAASWRRCWAPPPGATRTSRAWRRLPAWPTSCATCADWTLDRIYLPA